MHIVLHSDLLGIQFLSLHLQLPGHVIRDVSGGHTASHVEREGDKNFILVDLQHSTEDKHTRD